MDSPYPVAPFDDGRVKTKKVKKALTERIITREDIGAVFQRIAAAEEGGIDL